MIQLPEGPYDAAIIDPPWRWKSYSKKGDSKSPQAHYDTMGLEEIKAMPVNAMLAKDAVVYLWATSPMLRMAFEALDAWKLTYVSQLAWDKKRIGTGYWTRNQHEIVLICKKGKPRAPAAKLRIPSVCRRVGDRNRYPFIGGTSKPNRLNQKSLNYFLPPSAWQSVYSLAYTWGWLPHRSRPWRCRTKSRTPDRAQADIVRGLAIFPTFGRIEVAWPARFGPGPAEP